MLYSNRNRLKMIVSRHYLKISMSDCPKGRRVLELILQKKGQMFKEKQVQML